MALFKIFRGNSLTLPKTYKDGYCYFTIDDGKMYIDTKDNDPTGRICLNAQKANEVYSHYENNDIGYASTVNIKDGMIKIDEYGMADSGFYFANHSDGDSTSIYSGLITQCSGRGGQMELGSSFLEFYHADDEGSTTYNTAGLSYKGNLILDYEEQLFNGTSNSTIELHNNFSNTYGTLNVDIFDGQIQLSDNNASVSYGMFPFGITNTDTSSSIAFNSEQINLLDSNGEGAYITRNGLEIAGMWPNITQYNLRNIKHRNNIILDLENKKFYGSLGTARTITIGNTGKSFDGSSNVSWSHAEMGVLPLTGGTLTGKLNIGDNLSLFSDNEGGNIHFKTPDGNHYEIDNYNNNLRVYRNNGSQTWTFQADGVFHSRGNLSSNDSLYLYKNNRTVGLQTDINGNSCWINWKDNTHWTQIGLINESVGTDNIVHIYRQNGSSSIEDYKLIHTGNWWNYCFGTPHWGNAVDFNTLVDTGWYNRQGLNINTPYGGDGTSIDTHFFIETLHNSPTWIRQVAYDVRSERTYTRCQFDGTWYGWKQYLLGDIANPCNFYINTGNYSAHLEVSNNTSRGVCLRADNEGGNINLYSGNGHTNFWEIDSYNGDLRFYTWRESDGNYSGAVRIGQESGCLYGAVWNDYAEYRNQEEEIEPGYIVISTKNGKVKKTTQRLSPFDGVVSDTFGFAIGENNECKTPLAVAGRVLVYCEGDRNSYDIGDVVCASENGKACKMTREEIKEYPDRIVGTVSEIPDYDTWGQNPVKVNNRIWIKVK